jgi:hypothetical protein
MKRLKLVVFTGWLCFANYSGWKAQTTENKLQDSIILQPQPAVKIILTGAPLKELLNYKRIDTLLRLFKTDFAIAQESQLAPGTKVVHYLVNTNGKRRMKAESEDFQEPAFNLHKEANAMLMELPAYGYYLYDLKYGIEVQIFCSSPEQLKGLDLEELKDVLQSQKLKKTEVRRTRSYVIRKNESAWNGAARIFAPKDVLEINATFGLGVIGSKLSPETGVKIAILQTNRYGQPKWTAGLSFNLNLLTDFSNGDFTGIHAIQSLNGFFMASGSGIGEGLWKWVGVQAGYVFNSPGILNKSPKLGILTTFKGYQLGFHTYFLPRPLQGNQSVLYGLSFLF